MMEALGLVFLVLPAAVLAAALWTRRRRDDLAE
jgi:hypothetical protein